MTLENQWQYTLFGTTRDLNVGIPTFLALICKFQLREICLRLQFLSTEMRRKPQENWESCVIWWMMYRLKFIWGALRIYYMCLLPAIPSWDCDYLSRAYHCIKKSRLHFKVGTLFTDVFVLLHTKSYSNILRLAFCAFVVCRRLASATDEGARLHGCWVSGLWRGIQFPGPNFIGRWLQWRTETNVTPSDISGMWRLEKYNSTRDVMHI